MNPISERDFHLLADAVRRRHRATCTPEAAALLEQHAFRVMGYVDDLAEAESLNGMDYQVLRAAAILHEAEAGKGRAGGSSAVLAADLLRSIGADEDLVAAVERAVLRQDSDDAETCAEMLVHDACLLATIDAEAHRNGSPDARDRLHARIAALATDSARRIARRTLAPAARETASPLA